MEEFSRSALLRGMFPRLRDHLALIGSQPIRNVATLAGNLANASPIGDMTIFLLALDAELTLRHGQTQRRVALREFYRGYKDTDLRHGEEIESIDFAVPDVGAKFNFEKVRQAEASRYRFSQRGDQLPVGGWSVHHGSLLGGRGRTRAVVSGGHFGVPDRENVDGGDRARRGASRLSRDCPDR